MPQRKSARRLGHACPGGLVSAKSAEAAKAGATQHSAKQRSQSARRLRKRASSASVAGVTWSRCSDTVNGLLYEATELLLATTAGLGQHVSRSPLPERTRCRYR